MRYGLSAQAILSLWEVGLSLHPVDRALLILAVAYPEAPRETLLGLSAGQRDGYLLAVREGTFGAQVAGYAECPACQERLEFACAAADLRVAPIDEQALLEAPARQEHLCSIEGYRLSFRLPDSRDLAALVQCREVSAAHLLLVQRCVLSVKRDEQAVAPAALPERVVTALAEQIAQCDPQAEVQLALTCPACQQGWAVLFDVVTFFWAELCREAKRLMREVHRLARAYGWREADILAMSATRRQFYLEMVP